MFIKKYLGPWHHLFLIKKKIASNIRKYKKILKISFLLRV